MGDRTTKASLSENDTGPEWTMALKSRSRVNLFGMSAAGAVAVEQGSRYKYRTGGAAMRESSVPTVEYLAEGMCDGDSTRW